MTLDEESHLRGYLVTATLARSASESAGPALLLVTIAVVGSAATGSYVVACMTVSAAVAGPFVGAILDRAGSARRAFTATMVLMAGGLAAIALAIGNVPIGVVMALAAVAGIGYPAVTGAWSAQLPRLVPAGALRRAYASDAATYSVAAVVAPPVAAALIALSVHAPLWLPVLLLLVSSVALRWVPVSAPPSAGSVSMSADLRAGTAVLARNRTLRRTVIITTVGFAGQAAIFVSAPLLAESMTGSLEFTGLVLGAFAAGGVLAALWLTRHPVARPDRAVIAGTVASAACLALVGLAGTPWLLLVAAFAMGASEPPIVSSMFQVRVRESPVHVQSQVFTTSASLRMCAFAAALAACGALVSVGIWAIIAFGVALHLLSLVLGLALGPDLPHRSTWVHREG